MNVKEIINLSIIYYETEQLHISGVYWEGQLRGYKSPPILKPP